MSLPEPIFGWPLVINIQGGAATTTNDGTVIVKFPITFNSLPTPVAVAGDLTSVANNHVGMQTGEITKTQFYMRVSLGSGWSQGNDHRWIAIGR